MNYANNWMSHEYWSLITKILWLPGLILGRATVNKGLICPIFSGPGQKEKEKFETIFDFQSGSPLLPIILHNSGIVEEQNMM